VQACLGPRCHFSLLVASLRSRIKCLGLKPKVQELLGFRLLTLARTFHKLGQIKLYEEEKHLCLPLRVSTKQDFLQQDKQFNHLHQQETIKLQKITYFTQESRV
jgi:hypothetical protein